ncbi:MAG TPA: ATP-binding protein [Fimbriimonadaceae bacterium]|jgi:hypothetical protein
MSIFSRPLADITKSEIEALLTDGVREGQTIEFKESLNLESKEAKEEFIRDLTSFANTSGGDYLVGIKERDAVAVEIPGLVFPQGLDRFELQIQEVARKWAKPPLPPVTIKEITGFPNGSVLIIRVPRSYNAPHLPSINDETPFQARRSNGKSRMTVSEVRDTFLRSEVVSSKMETFIQDRLGLIRLRSLSYNAAAVVVHVLPLASFSGDFAIDVTQIHPSDLSSGNHFQASSYRHNFLGFKVMCSNFTNHILSEAQVFRNGLIEGISYILIEHPGAQKGQFDNSDLFVSHSLESELIGATRTYLAVMGHRDMPPPVFVSWSIKGAEGAQRGSYPPIDVNQLTIPPVELEKSLYQTDAELATAMKDALDILAQTMGMPIQTRQKWMDGSS